MSNQIELSRVAVALAIYKNDKPQYIKLAIDSLLSQTMQCDIFIQVDGLVSSEILAVLKKYEYNLNVKIYYNSVQLGLATRLNQIIDIVIKFNQYVYLARMDADDISSDNRFFEQVKFLYDHPNIAVVGSDVIEIDKDGTEVFYKKMDSDPVKLKEDIIKKCPLNHPSVMFRIDVFIDGLRYNPNLLNTQDYYLWVDIMALGKDLSNINKPLLKFRVDESFHERRGVKKLLNEVKSRFYAFNKLGNFSFFNMILVLLLILLRISPVLLKKWAYKKFR